MIPVGIGGVFAFVGHTVFLLGAAVVHIEQILIAHNYSTNNTGIILYTDIFVPLILIALLIYYGYAGRHERGLAGAQQSTEQTR